MRWHQCLLLPTNSVGLKTGNKKADSWCFKPSFRHQIFIKCLQMREKWGLAGGGVDTCSRRWRWANGQKFWLHSFCGCCVSTVHSTRPERAPLLQETGEDGGGRRRSRSVGGERLWHLGGGWSPSPSAFTQTRSEKWLLREWDPGSHRREQGVKMRALENVLSLKTLSWVFLKSVF